MRKTNKLYNVLLFPYFQINMDLYYKKFYYSSPVTTYKLSAEELMKYNK